MSRTVAMNKCKGNPGTDTFIYKLPKGITVSSIRFAINVICLSGLPGSDTDIDNEIVENNLVKIYPHLNRTICRHLILIHSDTMHNVSHSTTENTDCIRNVDNNSCLMCAKELVSNGTIV